MKIKSLHEWPISIAEAKAIQERFRSQVILKTAVPEVSRVAGVDIGFEDQGKTTRAAIVVLDFQTLALIEKQLVRVKTRFPYVPGYLSFREIPAALIAFEKIKNTPDLILCDGQGIAHPRRFGLACHLGLWTDTPCIGVAKSRLIGSYQEPAMKKGSWKPLMDQDEVIGAVLRTRDNTNPLFVSIGHLVDLQTAIEYTLRCTTKFRLPETTRLAHKLASG